MRVQLFSAVSMLFLLASCGNPHVEVKKLSDRVRFPSIAAPTGVDVKSPEISTDDESGSLSIITKKPEAKKEVKVTNPNPASDLLISFKVEIGKHFRLENGDCADLIKATALCTPVVVFNSEKVGVYKDNLIITYRSFSRPELSKNVIVPLKGERIVDENTPIEVKPLLLSGADGTSEIKFATKESYTKELLRSQNPNANSDLIVSYALESGKFFKLDENDCKSVLPKDSMCSPVVIFSAVDAGIYKDNVIATYSSVSHPELSKKVLLPVIAEKLSDIKPGNLA